MILHSGDELECLVYIFPFLTDGVPDFLLIVLVRFALAAWGPARALAERPRSIALVEQVLRLGFIWMKQDVNFFLLGLGSFPTTPEPAVNTFSPLFEIFVWDNA